MTINASTRDFGQAARLEAESARAREHNVALFTRMFLSLGPDVTKLDGTRFDEQMLEARGHAASRWSRLLDLEAQVQRDEVALASRPKKRPSEPGDDLVPDRTLAERDRAFEQETKVRRESLAALKDQAKAERRELEGFTSKRT